MIIDAHTHVFPPSVRERRAELVASEPAFAEIYADPKAAMATAEDVLASMDEAGVAHSVIANFAWRDAGLIEETNAYLLDAAARSGGRLIPFVSLPPLAVGRHGGAEFEEAPRAGAADPRATLRALASAGARGIGELRPEQSGYDLADSDEADLLAWAASAFDLVLLFHVSEPAGHQYAGKRGLAPAALCAFAQAAQGVHIIAAHWGGGLPFYTLMPEVRDALATTWFDTSAEHLLYDPAIYRRAIDLVGHEKILWGSDFPLTSQRRALERTRAAGLSDEELAAIVGGNSRELLGL
ncbi:MAG TPA: amidohydrolase family protein [Dehalococcoidia bacterium]|jgi:predicted TIM-barrel fold metal-dependent hydrolase|nr:amidohydrolase family protein [Dehalococcoidia bacterium]